MFSTYHFSVTVLPAVAWAQSTAPFQ
uniref:Uncharacterized protein n=1 Tax=Anguilla anguilla TaxID=7936 RepID=A0A0E9W4M2_ANGAN